jgi:hypothetical protein
MTRREGHGLKGKERVAKNTGGLMELFGTGLGSSQTPLTSLWSPEHNPALTKLMKRSGVGSILRP